MTEISLSTIENQPIVSAPRAEALCASAGRALIETDEHLAKSADLVKQIGSLLKTRADERLSFTKPLKDVARRIELRFKPGDDALNTAKNHVQDLQREYERKRRVEAEAEAARLRNETEQNALAEAVRLEAEGKTEQAAEVLEEAAQSPVSTPPPPPKVARGELAGVSFRTVWHAEIQDWATVCAIPVVIENEKVRETIQKVVDGLIRGGTRTLHGVRVYSTEEPTTR
jgi:hypothetical protein